MKKFVFNKKTLSYEEQKVPIIRTLGKAIVYLIISLVIAILYYALFSVLFSNGKEKRLIQENEYLEVEVKNLEEKVALVDDVVKNLDIRDKAIYRQIFNSNPPKIKGGIAELDSIPSADSLFAKSEFDLIYQTNTQCNIAKRSVRIVNSDINAINNKIHSTDFKPNSFPSIIPLKNFTLAQTGASIGMKMHPYYKTLVMHTGIDLIAPLGTDVIATADGKVSKIERLNKGFGSTITIDHGNGLKTFYAHLGDIYVRVGQNVKQGAVIARVGASGTVFASSLHYEVRRGDEYMDPINYFFASISPSIYFKMLQIATNTGQSLD